MYLLYLDESGDPGWYPPYGRSPVRWFVLAGLSLEENKWAQAHHDLFEIVDNYFGVFPKIRDLRYSALIAGDSPFDILDGLTRKTLADEIFELILKLEPVLFAIAIDKHRHKEKWQEGAFSPKVWSLQLMAPRFHKYLERVNGYGIFVMDEEETRSDARLKKIIQRSREAGIIIQSIFDPFRTNTTLPRLIESVLFVKSEDSPGIPLTDFCGHAVWRHFERDQSNRFQQIYSLFDKVGENVYGLKVWPP